MDTLISNVTIVTMNEKMDVLFGAFLGIKDGKIASVSKVAPKEQPATIIDGTGMVVMPGLINCHTHLATTGLRSYCDDLSAHEALDAQLVKEDKMDSRSAKAAALLGIAECLRFGVTSVSDLGVPAADNLSVHFLHRFKRPIIKFDNISMAQVQVTCKKHFPHGLITTVRKDVFTIYYRFCFYNRSTVHI